MKPTWKFLPCDSIHPVNAQGRKKADKYVGRTTRMGVEQYQDYTLYINVDRDGLAGRQLNDEQLCADWQHEFPEAVKFTPFHVQGVRRDYLEGRTRESTGTGSSHGVRDENGEVSGSGL